MDYDFFNDNNQPNGVENSNQPIHAPTEMVDMSPPSKKKQWKKTVLAIGLALAIFVSGMGATWLLLDPEIRTLVSIKRKIQNNYYQEITDEDFYKEIFGAINEDLLDKYSEYMTPEEFEEMLDNMQGKRSGVGLAFGAQQTDPLRITRVCGNSPAEVAGIVVGERIVACGQTEMDLAAIATFDELAAFLANYKEDEEFFVKLRFEEEERVVKLRKAAYVENYVFYRTNTTAYAFTGANADVLTERGSPLTCLDENTAYIHLVQFTGKATKEFALAMDQFQKEGKKNLVLDLRGNGGGYLDVMQEIASYFCKTATEKEPVVAVADFGKKETKYRAKGNYYAKYFANNSRIYVLADESSASASECLIGCMLDYGAIGYQNLCLVERDGVAKTYGKGIMQETSHVSFVKKDAITLTTAEIRWPVSGISIHGRGVLPVDGALVCAENIDHETETINAIQTLLK